GEPCARHGQTVTALTRLVVAQINELVLCVGRVEDNIEQTTLTATIDLGHSRNWRRLLAVGSDDEEFSVDLCGDQHVPIREKRDGPGFVEAVGDLSHLKGRF